MNIKKQPAGPLKILCVADHVDPLVYSLNAKERFKDVDLVLSAGDLSMSYLGFIASILNKEVIFVFGNHNLRHLNLFKKSNYMERERFRDVNYTQNFFGSTYIGDKVKNIKGLLIAGLGGSRRYNRGENQFSEREMWFKILHMVPRLLFNKIFYGRYLDILLTHSPPLGLGDGNDLPHRGFKVFIKFITLFKPRYLLHGHVHLWDQNGKREVTYKDTTIINVYDHYVLNYSPDEPRATEGG